MSSGGFALGDRSLQAISENRCQSRRAAARVPFLDDDALVDESLGGSGLGCQRLRLVWAARERLGSK
jgi:hypothetical protein